MKGLGAAELVCPGGSKDTAGHSAGTAGRVSPVRIRTLASPPSMGWTGGPGAGLAGLMLPVSVGRGAEDPRPWEKVAAGVARAWGTGPRVGAARWPNSGGIGVQSAPPPAEGTALYPGRWRLSACVTLSPEAVQALWMVGGRGAREGLQAVLGGSAASGKVGRGRLGKEGFTASPTETSGKNRLLPAMVPLPPVGERFRWRLQVFGRAGSARGPLAWLPGGGAAPAHPAPRPAWGPLGFGGAPLAGTMACPS